MKYYLMDSVAEQRLIIDTKVIDGCGIAGEVDAGSWIEAKKLLGFELTPTQEMMLEIRTKAAA